MPSSLALVLSGGGARGAYEAGVLHYVRTALPNPAREAKFNIVCGTSVGALNAAFLAATADDPALQGQLVHDLWAGIDEDRIFKRDWMEVGKFIFFGVWRLAGNFLWPNPGKHNSLKKPFASLFNTGPFPEYLRTLIPFDAIARNTAAGYLDALAIAATNLSENRTELFIHKRHDLYYHGDYVWHDVEFNERHLLASAAIPFAFPPVRLLGGYYMDGGIHLNTPVSPAIQLGADRILVIGMHARTRSANSNHADEYPGPGRIAAAIADALFQDRVTYDMEQLTRINRIIDWGAGAYGPDFLQTINDHALRTGETGDIASRGLRRITTLTIKPSRDLADVYEEQLRDNPYFDEAFSSFERFAMRFLSLDPLEGRELFSYLVFANKYIQALLDLGFKDAAARHDELSAFLAPEAENPPEFVLAP
jgi:NTE family protein